MTRNTLILTASTIALLGAAPAMAQDEVDLISDWTYEPLYADGWSVEAMFDETEILGTDGEQLGDVENVIFSNDGEVLGIIAQVGGFWDIGDIHIHVPWDEVTMEGGPRRIVIPVTEETVDDYDVFGEPWEEDETLTEEETDTTQGVNDELLAGEGVFKATDLVGDYAYLPGGLRYGYISDIIVRDGAIDALVTDAAASGRYGYYAFPYVNGTDTAGPRYDLPYDEAEAATIESFDYNRLQSGVPEQ